MKQNNNQKYSYHIHIDTLIPQSRKFYTQNIFINTHSLHYISITHIRATPSYTLGDDICAPTSRKNSINLSTPRPFSNTDYLLYVQVFMLSCSGLVYPICPMKLFRFIAFMPSLHFMYSQQSPFGLLLRSGQQRCVA